MRTLIIILIFQLGAFGQSGIDYYYGIGVEKDYKKAFSAFSESNYSTSTPFIIIMYLNGDGIEKDPNKALKVWNDATETTGSIDATMQKLKRIIDERLANPTGEYEHIEYCDIAVTTIDRADCFLIQNELKDQELQNEILQITNKFDQKQKILLNKIQTNYLIIEENDSERIYNLYIGGTIRRSAASGMEAYDKERHMNRMKKFIVDNNFDYYTETDYIKADKRLNECYKWLRYERTNNSEINQNLKKAQLAWIKYRDNWVKLVKTLNNDENIEATIKTILTIERIEELNYDLVDENDGPPCAGQN